MHDITGLVARLKKVQLYMEDGGLTDIPYEAAAALTALQVERDAWKDRAEAAEAANRIHNLNAEALSEIKAVVDGLSDQPISSIIYGLIDEIDNLPDSKVVANEVLDG